MTFVRCLVGSAALVVATGVGNLGAANADAKQTGTCATSVLRGGLHRRGAGGGTQIFTLRLTNRGTSACRVKGFPGVSAIDRTGHAGRSADRDGPAGTTHVLAPGGSIHGNLTEASNACLDGLHAHSRSVALLVIPPDQHRSLRIPTSAFTVCQRQSLNVRAFGEKLIP